MTSLYTIIVVTGATSRVYKGCSSIRNDGKTLYFTNVRGDRVETNCPYIIEPESA